MIGRLRSLDDIDRQIAGLALPALGALAVEPLYVLVDTAIVGHLGSPQLGGLALASTVLTSLLWVCNFLSWGVTSRVAFLTGAGRGRQAASIAVQALWLCVSLGVPIALVVGLAGPEISHLLGGRGHVLAAATTYLHISALGVPAVLVALAGNGFYRGLSDTRTPLVVVVVANVVNVVLEILFVYGLHTGVAGSAWGTVAAQWLAAGWFLAIIAARVRRAGSGVAVDRSEMRGLAAAGRHLLVRSGSILAALALATAVATHLGTLSLAAHQIAYQLFLFLALSVDAVAIAGQAMVGTALGAGDRDRARRLGRRLLGVATVVGAGLGAVVVATSGLLPHLFTGSAAVAAKAQPVLVVLGVLQLPGAYAFVLDGVLMGASDFRFLQWATFGALCAFAPFAAAVAADHRLGLVGLWVGLAVWMTLRALANWTRFSRSHWGVVAVGEAALA